MAATVLFEIKKKQHVTTTKKSPFPLIFHLGCDEKQSIVTWQFYKGSLQPDGVEISSGEEMNLYYMGYFGKGSLSRSAPVFDRESRSNGTPPKLSTRRYERHCRLYNQEVNWPGAKLLEPSSGELSSRAVLVRQEDNGDSSVSCPTADNKGSSDKECAGGSDEPKASAEEKAPSGLCIGDEKYCLSEDPYPIDEKLQLFFEEAYFLSFGLGCLIVQENGKELELLELWQRLCTLCPNFPARYAAYHHFRAKGWVVRTGSKYGADYLLYKDGPPFYHATFSVVVRSAEGTQLRDMDDGRLRSWASLSGLVRVNANAMKTVLICYVVIPPETDLSTPECVRSFKIQETLVRRWALAEEGEKQRQAAANTRRS